MEPTQENTHAPVAQSRTSTDRSTLALPVAIVVASVLVAGAIVFNSMQTSGGTQVANPTALKNGETPDIEVAPVTDQDHIRGNPDAPIVIIEYSDFDCPFCKNFHETMNKIMAEYGTDGKVAWVYRQFPLEQLHPNAPKIAQASECVASLGGNEAFWKFSDLIFGERAMNEPTDMKRLPEFAERAGVSTKEFNDCVASGKFENKVAESSAAAMKAGARGTPHSFLVAGKEQGIINGAQPYGTVKQMIDTMLTQLESAN